MSDRFSINESFTEYFDFVAIVLTVSVPKNKRSSLNEWSDFP